MEGVQLLFLLALQHASAGSCMHTQTRRGNHHLLLLLCLAAVVRPILEKLLPADYHKWIGELS